MTQTGEGLLAFTGSNTYTGGTTISGGTLQLGDGAAKNGYLAGNILDNTTLAFATVVPQTYSGQISGAGSLAKVGSGSLTLSNTNVYSGTTSVAGGALRIGPTGSIAAASAINVTNSSTLALTAAANLPGNLITVNPGSLLDTTGASSFSLTAGNLLTIGQPTARAPISTATSPLAAARSTSAARAPRPRSPKPAISRSAAADLNFDLSSTGASDLVNVGNLSISSATAINVNMSGGSLGSGIYNLIDYSGSRNGSPATLTLNGVASGAVRQAFTLIASSSSAGTLSLQVTNAPASNLVWTGLQSGNWDSGLNWSLSGSASKFYTYDAVDFNDSANTGSVTLTMMVQPQSVLFNNNTLNYVFSVGTGGTGGISGTGSLTKNGGAMLTLGGSNTYSGGTIINGGTLVFASSQAIGGSGANVTANYGATAAAGYPVDRTS